MIDTLFQRQLEGLGACDEAREWVGDRRAGRAWRECDRGDWLLWLATGCGVERKVLVLAACACARTALQFVPTHETRPVLAIETAERWARGDINVCLDNVCSAAYANAAYAYAAANAAAYAAANAAAYAAYAAYAAAANAAAYAAYAVDYAAYAAAYAAADAAAADVRKRALADYAGIVRKFIPFPVLQLAYQSRKK